jgi:DNA polymerase I-like protein with 3'-5' exonuclease and polymerase domains
MEILIPLKKEDKELVKNIVKQSMLKVNEELKLNITINISVEFGTNYAETH